MLREYRIATLKSLGYLNVRLCPFRSGCWRHSLLADGFLKKKGGGKVRVANSSGAFSIHIYHDTRNMYNNIY